MTRERISVWVTVACLCCAAGLGAQSDSGSDTNPGARSVPRLIKFSGSMNPQITQTQNETPKPESGKSLDLTFSLYEAPEGGDALWTETQKAQLDGQGRYTVLLGATQPEGLPLSLFSSGKALWLGVQAQAPGAGEQ